MHLAGCPWHTSQQHHASLRKASPLLQQRRTSSTSSTHRNRRPPNHLGQELRLCRSSGSSSTTMQSGHGTTTTSKSSTSTAQLDALVQDGIVWASQHGLVVGLGSGNASVPAVALIHAPLSLLPVAFPQERFNQAKAAMTAFNNLIDRVAADEAYLAATLANAAQHDEFTARLLQLMRDSAPARRAAAAAAAAAAAGGGSAGGSAGGVLKPEVVLGVHRSDYMLDAPSGGFLQVELNTIASSFGCLSSLTTQLHAHTLDRLAAAAATASSGQPQQQSHPQQSQQQQLLCLLDRQRLPPNQAMAGISKALAAATHAAANGGSTSSSSATAAGAAAASPVLVMVVQPGERNAYDQQWLQQTLWEQHRVVTHRLSLAEIADGALQLRPLVAVGGAGTATQQQQQELVLASTGQTVGCVYFRAGYTPNDYPTDKEWQARALIEASTACKCPSVTYQLAGAKKVQQDLAAPGVVERFVGQQQGAALRQLFAGLWSLDDPSDPKTAAVIQDAIQNPDRYVLKPQREGGGNNLYGPELVQQLQQGVAAAAAAAAGGGDGGEGSSSSSTLAAFILMQRIVPPPQRTVFVRGGAASEDESLSELGIYGTYLRVGQQVLLNEEVGHLVRTKTSSSNEGGVAAGFAVLDSPLLTQPGEGLLHPMVEEGSGGGGDAKQGSDSSWGARGGVLAVAKALLQ